MDPFIVSEKKEHGIDTLAGLHEHAVRMAEAAFAAHNKAPFRWLLRQGRKRLTIIDTPWENTREKAMHVHLLRIYMALMDIDAYSQMSEAWIGMEQKGAELIPPSELPPDQREDILLVVTFDRAGGHMTTRYGVSRADTPWAKLKVRDDWPASSFNDYSGPMFNLLEPERPMEEAITLTPEQVAVRRAERQRAEIEADAATARVTGISMDDAKRMAAAMPAQDLVKLLLRIQGVVASARFARERS